MHQQSPGITNIQIKIALKPSNIFGIGPFLSGGRYDKASIYQKKIII